MSELRLYNTLTRRKEVFEPADPGRVTMYVCGPTVYSRAHIGNARPAVVFDVLRRLLRHRYGADSIVYARNVTDIDDKIMAAAVREGVGIDDITARYEKHYLDDMGALGVEPPDLAPHATAYVPQMIVMIERLVARGVAYAAEGHVLFDVGAHPGYGALSRRPLAEMIAGARVEVAPYKRSPADFVLWKPSAEDQPGWDSPWGWGRPGWHIECSAMIAAELGETVDIHGGGLDLVFPHHENELAQSACAHGQPLAQFWMHNGFLNMGGGDKMSKSLGNVVTVADLLAQGWHGEVIRLALLSAHYRQPLDWSEELLSQTKAISDDIVGLGSTRFGQLTPAEPNADVVDALLDDLNTHAAIQAVQVIAKKATRLQREPLTSTIVDTDDGVLSALRGVTAELVASASLLGIVPEAIRPARSDEQWIGRLKNERLAARARRDFAEADRIRAELAEAGIVLEDRPDGTTDWRRA